MERFSMTVLRQEIFLEKITEVEHPEIACTLQELGMIRDVSLDSNAHEAQLTLVVPVLSIPSSIRNLLIDGLSAAAGEVGVQLTISTAEMNPQERQEFVKLARTCWRDEGTDVVPCGS
jgi:metal-sulfur cluster biosynthetic enzyme